MEDFDKLMWGDFDYKNRDFPEEATERMNEQRFAREYTVYKMGDLVNKIITLDKKFELPLIRFFMYLTTYRILIIIRMLQE